MMKLYFCIHVGERIFYFLDVFNSSIMNYLILNYNVTIVISQFLSNIYSPMFYVHLNDFISLSLDLYNLFA